MIRQSKKQQDKSEICSCPAVLINRIVLIRLILQTLQRCRNLTSTLDEFEW